MFTGIVAKTGTVAANAGRALRVSARLGRLRRGDSVAVNGVCLTVTRIAGAVMSFDVGPDTRRLSNLEGLRTGDRVNLELPLRMGDPLGGHMVSGHVEAAAPILEKAALPDGFVRLRTALPAELAPCVAPKGSVTLDGVSLTVTRVGRGWFECMLIPETLERTTLGRKGPGARINLETDLVARHVLRVLATRRRK
ncbi:MAG: riboflavin synthase [Elusimicrobia bacterium]|nr:riboflavin synthase [Elusimicrobiota bacterium]